MSRQITKRIQEGIGDSCCLAGRREREREERCRRGGLIALPWDGNERKRSRKKIADEDDEDFRELKFRSLPGIPVFRRIVAIKNTAKGAGGGRGGKKKEERKAEDNAGG